MTKDKAITKLAEVLTGVNPSYLTLRHGGYNVASLENHSSYHGLLHDLLVTLNDGQFLGDMGNPYGVLTIPVEMVTDIYIANNHQDGLVFEI